VTDDTRTVGIPADRAKEFQMGHRNPFADGRASLAATPTSRRSLLRGAGLLALASTAAPLLAACGRDGSSASDGGLELGLSIPFLTTPFFAVLDSYVQSEVKAQGVSMLNTTNANQDAGKQLTDIDSLVNSGATGILAGVVDNKAIKPALDKCASQDIPFVALDDAPAQGKLTIVVRADNYQMGATAAKKMAELIGSKGQVLSIQGDLATTNGKDRSDGFREWMEKNAPGVEVIERPAKWQGPLAGSVTATILTQYPQLAGIYMQADTTYGSAVMAALDSAGRLAPAGDPKHMPLVSIDGGAEGLDAIREGTLDALVSQPLDGYAKYGVQYLKESVAGETFAKGPTDHDSEIIDFAGNLMDLLPATLVTKENVDDDSLWGNDPLAKG
jgi:ribose transport system substrate-binding protein